MNDIQFMRAVMHGLGGKCDLVRDAGSTRAWVTFQNVARGVRRALAPAGRELFVRSAAGAPDFRIRDVDVPDHVARPWKVTTEPIVDAAGKKSPPVKLLTDFDEVVFLGETNGQLAEFVEQAFALRGRRRWKRLEILSIEDLTTAARHGTLVNDLIRERDEMEAFFQRSAERLAEHLALYRYDYAGTYGSFWTSKDGQRRAHVSAKLAGLNIRFSPASDYLDFEGARHPIVEGYFQMARSVIQSCSAERCVFRFPGS